MKLDCIVVSIIRELEQVLSLIVARVTYVVESFRFLSMETHESGNWKTTKSYFDL